MLKIRLNLMKVATIVACLAVTTAFCGCGNGGSDDDDENGGSSSSNSALAGWTWRCNTSRQVLRLIGGSYSYTFEVVEDYYMFLSGGKFLYFPYDERFAYYEGTYSTSEGKMYFKNVNRRNTETEEILTNFDVQKVIEMEYKIAKDEQGEYLHTGSLQYFRNTQTVDISRADKYRKAEAIKQ